MVFSLQFTCRERPLNYCKQREWYFHYNLPVVRDHFSQDRPPFPDHFSDQGYSLIGLTVTSGRETILPTPPVASLG